MERVVLLAEDGERIGAMPKERVHSAATPLHLAFSCYLSDTDGRLLLTRRALGKQTWPGVWTNSFCGHPDPDEQMHGAIRRRADQELGCRVRDIRMVLPDFRYRAVDASGVVENELCPVFTAVLDGELHPNPAEVAQWDWIDPVAAKAAVAATPFAFSPWMVEQLTQLTPQAVT